MFPPRASFVSSEVLGFSVLGAFVSQERDLYNPHILGHLTARFVPNLCPQFSYYRKFSVDSTSRKLQKVTLKESLRHLFDQIIAVGENIA